MSRLSQADQAAFADVKALCYAGLDSGQLRSAVAERLARHTGADGSLFLMLDPASGLPVHAVAEAWEVRRPAMAQALFHSPVLDFARRAGHGPRVQVLEQVLESAGCAGDPAADAYVAQLLGAAGYRYDLQAIFAADGRPWGWLSLARHAAHGPFQGSDARLVDALVPHVTAGLRTAAARAALTACPGPEIGVVLVGPAGRIEMTNGAAERLLQRPRCLGQETFCYVVDLLGRGALLRLHGAAGDLDELPAVTVTDETLGETYRLRAEPACGADGRPHALVLIEPARTADCADALLVFGLTPREMEVAALLAHGRSTAEIARALTVSPYTVKDHAQAVYEKVGVASRQELVAKLHGAIHLRAA